MHPGAPAPTCAPMQHVTRSGGYPAPVPVASATLRRHTRLHPTTRRRVISRLMLRPTQLLRRAASPLPAPPPSYRLPAASEQPLHARSGSSAAAATTTCGPSLLAFPRATHAAPRRPQMQHLAL